MNVENKLLIGVLVRQSRRFAHSDVNCVAGHIQCPAESAVAVAARVGPVVQGRLVDALTIGTLKLIDQSLRREVVALCAQRLAGRVAHHLPVGNVGVFSRIHHLHDYLATRIACLTCQRKQVLIAGVQAIVGRFYERVRGFFHRFPVLDKQAQPTFQAVGKALARPAPFGGIQVESSVGFVQIFVESGHNLRHRRANLRFVGRRFERLSDKRHIAKAYQQVKITPGPQREGFGPHPGVGGLGRNSLPALHAFQKTVGPHNEPVTLRPCPVGPGVAGRKRPIVALRHYRLRVVFAGDYKISGGFEPFQVGYVALHVPEGGSVHTRQAQPNFGFVGVKRDTRWRVKRLPIQKIRATGKRQNGKN